MKMNFPQVNGYDITEKIGAGAYSTVYKAHKKGNVNDVYAVKCIDKQYHKKSFADNIVKEISLMKQLIHRHIVDLKDFSWNTKHIFIITEYCDGGDLASLIRSRHKLRESVVKKLMQQLAQALQYLRENNVCHMDLKPQNLLLTWKPELTLKVADFGLSQHLTGDNEQWRFVGSPLYMAPEKLLHLKFDARVDLWSTGVIMFECLFGRPPYTNLSSHTLTLMTKQIAIELPKHINISTNCEDLLRRLLKHNPEERINFDEFFAHPFLNMAEPMEENYQKAHDLVQNAIKLDQEEKYSESLPLYEKAILFLEQLLGGEIDLQRKSSIQLRLAEYTTWAKIIRENIENKKNPQSSTSKTILITKEDYDNLLTLAQPTPELANALEIGKIGELYLAEGQYNLALEKLKSALGILMPTLQTEPIGPRRTLLHKQVQIWLKTAENISSKISL